MGHDHHVMYFLKYMWHDDITPCWKKTNEIDIGKWDWTTLQMQ